MVCTRHGGVEGDAHREEFPASDRQFRAQALSIVGRYIGRVCWSAGGTEDRARSDRSSKSMCAKTFAVGRQLSALITIHYVCQMSISTPKNVQSKAYSKRAREDSDTRDNLKGSGSCRGSLKISRRNASLRPSRECTFSSLYHCSFQRSLMYPSVSSLSSP